MERTMFPSGIVNGLIRSGSSLINMQPIRMIVNIVYS